MDLKDCFRKGLIKKTVPEDGLIRSLIAMAASKEIAVRSAPITAETISAFVSLAYDALREVLEALCVSRGHKVLSHICIGQLLRDLLPNFDYDTFDRIRWIRNSINYYGKSVELEQGKEIIEQIFALKRNMMQEHLSGYTDTAKNSDRAA